MTRRQQKRKSSNVSRTGKAARLQKKKRGVRGKSKDGEPKGHVAFELIKNKLKRSKPRRGRQDLENSPYAWDRLKQLRGGVRDDWSHPDLAAVVEEAARLPGVEAFTVATLKAELGFTTTSTDIRAACVEYLEQRIAAERDRRDIVALCKALETKARFYESEEQWAAAASVLTELWNTQREDFKEPVEAVRTGTRLVYVLIRDEQIRLAERRQTEVEALHDSALPSKSVLRTTLDVLLNRALLNESPRPYEKGLDTLPRNVEAERVLRECRELLKELSLSASDAQNHGWYAPLEAAISIRLGVALRKQRRFSDAYPELLDGLTKRVALGARSGLGRGVPHLADVYMAEAREALSQNQRERGLQCLRCAGWLYAVGIECLRIKGKRRSRAFAQLSRARAFKLLAENTQEQDVLEQRAAIEAMSSDFVELFDEMARPLAQGLAKLFDPARANAGKWRYLDVAAALASEAEKCANETDPPSEDILKEIREFQRELTSEEKP